MEMLDSGQWLVSTVVVAMFVMKISAKLYIMLNGHVFSRD